MRRQARLWRQAGQLAEGGPQPAFVLERVSRAVKRALARWGVSVAVIDVVASRQLQRRRFRPRGRPFPPRGYSRTASRKTIRPRADRASDKRRVAKPRNTVLLTAEKRCTGAEVQNRGDT
jgi:hypothetical protein